MNSNCNKKAGYCSTVSYPSFTCILAFALLFSVIGGGKILAQNCMDANQIPASNNNIGIHTATRSVDKALHIDGSSEGGCGDPSIRLSYSLNPQKYWGHLALLTPGNLNYYTLIPTHSPKDLVLQSDYNAEDLILTTRNNSGCIRFATTPDLGGTDYERMTILPTGLVGIFKTEPIKKLSKSVIS